MLLKDLTQKFGISGYEKEVREFIENEIKDYADEITTDAIGNLIVYKKGTGKNKKKIMMAAHTDEIGFQVTKIEKDGTIRVTGLGFHFPAMVYLNRVKFRNGMTGLVSCSGRIEDVKFDVTKLYIDIGVSSKEEASKYVKVGDIAGYVGEYVELKDDNVMAKSFDDRVGCYIMIETIKRLKEVKNDLYFVFTVQEELGCRGSKVTAARINPDMGIALDVTPAHDYPCDLEGSNALNAGTAIKVSDPSVICDEYLVEEMVKCCEENKIKYQLDVISRGGTDASSINLSNYGVKAAGISVVTRFPHSPNTMINMNDVNASIDLLTNYVNREFKF